MLIVKVQINNDPLDEILMQNIGHLVSGVYEYEIIGHEELGLIYHYRSDGYMILLAKALERLNVPGDDTFCSPNGGDRFPIRARGNGVSNTSKAGWADELLAAARDSGLC